MTTGLLFISGTGTRADYTGHGCTARPLASSRTSVGVVLLGHLVRLLLNCPAAQKVARRQRIAGYLTKARNPEPCIDELLLICTTEGGPDGLDTAIDILAQTGELVLDYAWRYLQRDVGNWSGAPERAYRPNDDYW